MTTATVNPLVVILQPRELQEAIDAINTDLKFVDKLWIKYHENRKAYEIMQQEFINRTEYTHLVILPDDLVVTKQAFHYLYLDVLNLDWPVISGYCNLETTPEWQFYSNVSQILPPNPPHTGTLQDYDFMKLEDLEMMAKRQHTQVMQVKYAGFPLTWIRRDVVQQIPFRDDDGCCNDSLFAWDLEDHNIPQFIDLRCNMKHLKLHDGAYQHMRVGIKPSEIVWDYKQPNESLW